MSLMWDGAPKPQPRPVDRDVMRANRFMLRLGLALLATAGVILWLRGGL